MNDKFEIVIRIFSFEAVLWLSAISFWLILAFILIGLAWTPVEIFFLWVRHFYGVFAWVWYPIGTIKERYPIMLKNIQDHRDSEKLMKTTSYKFVVWICKKRLNEHN